MRPLPDGRSLLAEDLVPGADEIVLALIDGKPVSGSLLAPPGATDFVVSLVEPDTFESVHVDVDDSGHFTSAPLPAGRWTVRAKAVLGTKRLEGEASATPGATVDVTPQEAK